MAEFLRADNARETRGSRRVQSGDLFKGNLSIRSRKKYSLIAALFSVIMLMLLFILHLCLNKNVVTVNFPQLSISLKESRPICRGIVVQESDRSSVHFPTPTTYSREECACSPIRFFAIISMQRSGSGWFETLLNSHRNVSCHGEIFSVKERRNNVSSIIATLDKIYNLDWFSSASKNECTAAVGLKWMLNQGLMENRVEIVEYFKRRRVSVIILLRRNLLQRLVSLLANSHDSQAKQLNGTHRAHVHSREEAEVLARYKPTIDIMQLIHEITLADELANNALDTFSSLHHTVLYYEDLVSNHSKAMDVIDFLKLPRRSLSSKHEKIHTEPLHKQIVNWDDVCNALKGTKYESFLYDQT